jgi:hypothetical protein
MPIIVIDLNCEDRKMSSFRIVCNAIWSINDAPENRKHPHDILREHGWTMGQLKDAFNLRFPYDQFDRDTNGVKHEVKQHHTIRPYESGDSWRSIG